MIWCWAMIFWVVGISEKILFTARNNIQIYRMNISWKLLKSLPKEVCSFVKFSFSLQFWISIHFNSSNRIWFNSTAHLSSKLNLPRHPHTASLSQIKFMSSTLRHVHHRHISANGIVRVEAQAIAMRVFVSNKLDLSPRECARVGNFYGARLVLR